MEGNLRVPGHMAISVIIDLLEIRTYLKACIL